MAKKGRPARNTGEDAKDFRLRHQPERRACKGMQRKKDADFTSVLMAFISKRKILGR
ncbi:MAG TPA: hypothetical protein VM571_07345 [Noviherbaspirillum sp.]|nr:hypothetical protein [Noviherbaspirillum sp.]